MDLLDFFRGRYSWRKLLLCINTLPRASAYREALLNDPDVAAHIAAQPEGPPSRPGWREYTPEREAQDAILDRLGEVVAAVIAAAGAKPPKVVPSLRPVTAVDRLKLAAERRAHDDLVADVKAAQERWQRARAAV